MPTSVDATEGAARQKRRVPLLAAIRAVSFANRIRATARGPDLRWRRMPSRYLPGTQDTHMKWRCVDEPDAVSLRERS